MERSLFGFIIRYSKRDQWMIAPLVVASMLFYFLSLDLPKTIINQAIQGKSFPDPGSTATFLKLHFALPEFLGGGALALFDGFDLERLPYLLVLTIVLLVLIVINGVLKFQINTMKGWMGERMLRRLRYVLFDHILRFPLPRFKRVKAAEMATMIKDEVEPLGGFIGEAFITPAFLGGQALTALFFILYQHVALGMVALGIVVVQAVIIPLMRRRLLVLAKERQLGARLLAGRIAECVDGIVEIHAHDTSNYERAELSSRLGRLFRIRFEFYQRKFLIKFWNNFLSQFAPFLFYSIGGYLVIVGKLDIGALVAVIAAYKDLPTPVKELIDWDLQRQEADLKYNQVVEQFVADDLLPAEMQVMTDAPRVPGKGGLRATNLSLADESGGKLLDAVSFEIGPSQHLAIVGSQGCGGSELAQVLARLVFPDTGTVEVGGLDVTRAPESVTGRTLAYVGSPAYMFPVSVRDNVLYGLKHRPVGARTYEGEALRDREFHVREARRTGTPEEDINADWIDYAAAGVDGAQELDARIIEVLEVVDLQETIFELGLKSSARATSSSELSDSILRARRALHEELESLGIGDWVERFDPERYNRNATLAENLLFGTPVDRKFDLDNLARNDYVRRVLAETGLMDDMLKTGHKLAETMVELFSGLPAGHEFFERYSFVRHEDLPRVQEILARVGESSLKRIGEEDRNELLGLPFKLVQARHRLGLIDEAFEARIVDARRHFAAHLPGHLARSIEFFDPERYIAAASLQDNMLFGRVVGGQAGAAVRIGALLRKVLDELGMRPQVVRIGLEFQVGVAGARLAVADRQKIAMARAILRRPAVLIIDQALGMLDSASQQRVTDHVLNYCRERCVIWNLSRTELARHFDQVLALDRGRVAERGAYDELESGGGALRRLLGPG